MGRTAAATPSRPGCQGGPAGRGLGPRRRTDRRRHRLGHPPVPGLRGRPEGRLLVFDMGGGTLDIAVLDIVGGARPEVSVLTALGTAYAGDMLDHAIARDLFEDLGGRGFDLEAVPHPELMRALVLRAARDAKVNLSRLPEHRIVLPSRGSDGFPSSPIRVSSWRTLSDLRWTQPSSWFGRPCAPLG
ncbi:Hsp70 family protein [Micromonospora sp. BRA006-A]|nr:Hsp70 family protein [Micromonospora sp. BRA006-A]